MDIEKLPQTQWPKRLLEIPHPPKTLWIQGTLPQHEYTWLTVVGSRNHTQYGADVCRMLMHSLRGLPVVIVSGLALGIDARAHTYALEAGLPCVAIPGSGIATHVLSPSQNQQLAKRITTSGGCILSEFPPNHPSAKWTFPQRNRIMVGISHAVLIIESAEKSGTLITARLGTEYNRDVFAVPGSIFSAQSSGAHMLISLGATPITSGTSLRDALGFTTHHTQRTLPIQLNTLQEKIMCALATPKTRDALATELSLPIHILNQNLVDLEIKQGVAHSNGVYRRVDIT